MELQPVLRRLRRAVLLIKKRSIFDRFISSIRVIDPSAIVRREVGTVASGVISQEDLNSQQIYCFSADSCSPFFLGGDRSIQLSYGGLYRKYSILQGSRIRTIRFLGGGRSILLSYGRIKYKHVLQNGLLYFSLGGERCQRLFRGRKWEIYRIRSESLILAPHTALPPTAFPHVTNR